MALGANRADIRRQTLLRGARLFAAGAVSGLPCALFLAHLLARLVLRSPNHRHGHADKHDPVSRSGGRAGFLASRSARLFDRSHAGAARGLRRFRDHLVRRSACSLFSCHRPKGGILRQFTGRLSALPARNIKVRVSHISRETSEMWGTLWSVLGKDPQTIQLHPSVGRQSPCLYLFPAPCQMMRSEET